MKMQYPNEDAVRQATDRAFQSRGRFGSRMRSPCNLRVIARSPRAIKCAYRRILCATSCVRSFGQARLTPMTGRYILRYVCGDRALISADLRSGRDEADCHHGRSENLCETFEWVEASYHWEVKQDFDETFCAPSERREYIKTLAPRAGPGTSSKCRDSSQANCTTISLAFVVERTL
jgi:hypothetical protein